MTELSAFLTLPIEGQTPMKDLTHKLRLLALRELLTCAPPVGPVGTTLVALQRQMPALLKQDSASVLTLLGRPEVLTPLLCLKSGVGDASDLLAEMMPHFIAGLKPNPPLLWDVPFERLLVGDRWIQFSRPCRAMIADVSGVELELSDGKRVSVANVDSEARGWPLDEGIELARVDTNPLRMREAHPDKEGNWLSFGEKSPSEWQDRLNEALAIVRSVLPTFGAELPHTLSRIVPVGFEPERHLSASYREAPGTIYMTLHPSTLTLAEAIVHEVQHAKLNTISWFDAILHNAMTEWCASPVRPDLRPIWGVLLAVHAFVPVAVLHQRLQEMGHPISQTPDFERRQVEVLQGNENGLKLLKEKAEPTPLGLKVIDDLGELHSYCLEKSTDLRPRFQDSVLPPG